MTKSKSSGNCVNNMFAFQGTMKKKTKYTLFLKLKAFKHIET